MRSVPAGICDCNLIAVRRIYQCTVHESLSLAILFPNFWVFDNLIDEKLNLSAGFLVFTHNEHVAYLSDSFLLPFLSVCCFAHLYFQLHFLSFCCVGARRIWPLWSFLLSLSSFFWLCSIFSHTDIFIVVVLIEFIFCFWILSHGQKVNISTLKMILWRDHQVFSRILKASFFYIRFFYIFGIYIGCKVWIHHHPHQMTIQWSKSCLLHSLAFPTGLLRQLLFHTILMNDI